MRDSVVFYRSFLDAIECVPEKDQLAALKAIIRYGLDGSVPEESGIAAAIFMMAKPQIDANSKRYTNGKKGGQNKQSATEPEPKRNQSVTKAIASEPVRKEAIAADTDTDTDTDTVTDTETVDEINTPPAPSKRGKVKKVDPFVEFAGDDAEMAEALSGFAEMRKKMRKPMTDRAKTLLLDKLEKLSPDRAGQIALLDEATAKNWLSVYDGSDYNRGSHAPPGSKGDEWDRLIASYGGHDEGVEIIDITEHC